MHITFEAMIYKTSFHYNSCAIDGNSYKHKCKCRLSYVPGNIYPIITYTDSE